LIDRDRYKEAREEILKALVSDAEDATALAMLGWVLSRLGNPKAGKAEAAKAVQIKPDSGYAHRALAFILLDLGQVREAEAEAREAVRLGPRDVHAYSALASSLNRQARWTQGLRAAEAGLEIDPNHENCGIYRVRALIHLKRFQEADAAAQAHLSENSESPYSQMSAGLACYNDGDMIDAFRHYREALRLAPNSDAARIGALRSLRATYLLHRVARWIDRRLDAFAKTRYGGGILRILFAVLGIIAANIALVGGPQRNAALLFLGTVIALVLASSLDGPILYLQVLGDPSGMPLLSRRQKWEGGSLGALVLAIALSGAAAGVSHSKLAFMGGAAGLAVFLVFVGASRSRFLIRWPLTNTLVAVLCAVAIAGFGLAGLIVR
jgi:Flp pilus assembly protein TadD